MIPPRAECTDSSWVGSRPLYGPLGRTGHTLIEILLALGLSLVILAAAYAALDQHWRYSEAGQLQTERMQITRALFEQLSADLRSIVFRPDGSEVVVDPIQIDVNQRVEQYIGRNVGIVGDGEMLVLRTDVPGDERSTGVQTIRWEMQEVASSDRAGAYSANNRPNVVLEQRAFGLARVAQREERLDVANIDSKPDVLAAEVTAIRFRYFAKGTWSEQWDSVEQQKLPQAVEVTIDFREAAAAERPTSDSTRPGKYRLIIPVPVAEA